MFDMLEIYSQKRVYMTATVSTTSTFYDSVRQQLEDIKESGLYKTERIIASPQGSLIRTDGGKEVINLCANNYSTGRTPGFAGEAVEV